MMKASVLLVLLVLICFGCSDSFEPLPEEEVDELAFLYGTYKLTALESDNPSNLNGGGTDPYNVVDELPCFESFIVLKEDQTLENNGPELDIQVDADTGDYRYACGPMQNSENAWNGNVNEVFLSGTTFKVQGDQLVDERDPATQLFHRVVYTKQ